MARTALVVTLTVRPGSREEFLAVWERHMAERVGANPVQEVVVVLPDAEHADVVHLLEVFADDAALRAHADDPPAWLTAYRSAVAPYLAGPARVVRGTPWWEKLPSS